MKRMTVSAILMAAVLAFTLAGCGSQAQSLSEDALKGTWKLDPESNMGIEAYANFTDDKVVEMLLGDAWLDGTFSASGTAGTITFNSYDYLMGDEESSSSSAKSEDIAKISLVNNKLVIGSENSSRLMFVRDDSEETKQMFAYDLDSTEGMVDSAGNPIEEVPEEISDIPPVTIVDDDKMSIVVNGKGTDYTADPCFRISMTNKTGKDVYVMPEDLFTVGGKQVEAGLGDDVAAGETVEIEVFFDKSELGGGVEMLSPADGVMVVYDNETDEEVAKYPFHVD